MSVPERGSFLETMHFHTLHFAFDTPGLLGGIEIYTPLAGDTILPLGWISVMTAWNGTTPRMWLLSEGFANDSESIGTAGSLDLVADVVSAHVTLPARTAWPAGCNAAILTDTTPLVIRVDDGSGASPGASQGEAIVTLCIVTSA